MTHIHIGHHFFGAGNLGDDLMLAGFFDALPADAGGTRFTCCIPWDLATMRLRFPAVEWLHYDDAARAQCIAECDAWLGLGDTPFQTTVGDWMLDHLTQEARWCAASGKDMFYLGVGVNDLAAAAHPTTGALVRQAAHIWTRDATSATLLGALVPEGRVSIGSDLAHIWLERQRFGAVTPGEIGIVLNFEDARQYTLPALAQMVEALTNRYSVHWLAQEVRPLKGSEGALYPQLPEPLRRRLPLVVPDYSVAPSTMALLGAWGVPEALLTSRYHATLIGAWMGCRVVAYPRSEKVRSAIAELGVASITDVGDAAATLAALADAQAVPRARLLEHAALAQGCCDEAWEVIRTRESNRPYRN